MASGITVNDKVKVIVEQMKVHKCDDDATQRLRILTFTIQNDEINVEREIKECDLCECDAFDKFLDLLTETECLYVLYDCHYENEEGIKKEDIIFGSWIPDTCDVKKRMKYASSKNSLKPLLKGLKFDIQMNDATDKDPNNFCEKIGPIRSIEGKPMNRGCRRK